MAYKHIVLNLGQPMSPNRAQMAARLAEADGAVLSGRYYAIDDNERRPSGGTPPLQSAAGLSAQATMPAAPAPEESRDGRKAKDIFEHATSQTSVTARFEAAPGADRTLSACLAEDAQCSDLVVVGKPTDGNGDKDLVRKLTQEIGGAVLVVPESAQQTPGQGHVVVAWDGSAAAARSVQRAMPLIERSGKVTIAMFKPNDVAMSSARRLQDVLQAHGAEVDTKTDTAGIGTADSLVSRAEELSADVLVMGAFGQSRLAEVATGGSTTNGVVQHATVSVLLAG